jgi:hypothetical protein
MSEASWAKSRGMKRARLKLQFAHGGDVATRFPTGPGMSKRWRDHTSMWHDEEGALVMVSQPYDLTDDELDELRDAMALLDVDVWEDEDATWHHPEVRGIVLRHRDRASKPVWNGTSRLR